MEFNIPPLGQYKMRLALRFFTFVQGLSRQRLVFFFEGPSILLLMRNTALLHTSFHNNVRVLFNACLRTAITTSIAEYMASPHASKINAFVLFLTC